MRIALTGFKGVGKTTLGRALAHALKLPFYDVDEAIERTTGLSCRALFEREGDAAFRLAEKRALTSLAQIERGVLALGGGSLLGDESRALIESRFRLFLLTEDREILRARFGTTPLTHDFDTFFVARTAHYATLRADPVTFKQETLSARTQELIDRIHHEQ